MLGQLRQDDKGNVVLTFGKHKGVDVRNVPRDYWAWCKSNGVFAEEAKEILRKATR